MRFGGHIGQGPRKRGLLFDGHAVLQGIELITGLEADTQAEVGNSWIALIVQEDVRGLDVPVNDALLVSGTQPL